MRFVNSWDELEPGQDDLVKDDNARGKLRDVVKAVKPGISDEENLYTDHDAGDPGRLAPRAENSLAGRDAEAHGPVKSSIVDKLKLGWESFKRTADERAEARKFRDRPADEISDDSAGRPTED